MAVELQIFYPNSDRDSQLIPITGSGIFHNDWKPVAEALKLKLIPELHSGLNISKAEIKDVLTELQIFRSYVEDSSNKMVLTSRSNTLSNIQRLIEALEEAQNEPQDIDLWFY